LDTACKEESSVGRKGSPPRQQVAQEDNNSAGNSSNKRVMTRFIMPQP
jgi:hypothetical protein